MNPQRFILLSIGTILCLLGIWQLMATNSYRATARIQIGDPAQSGYFDGPLEVEYDVIRSEYVLDKAIDTLQLSSRWGNQYASDPPHQTAEIRARLNRQMDLGPTGKSDPYLIDVRMVSGNPDEAAWLANAVTRAYQRFRLEQLCERQKKSITQLEETLRDIEAKTARIGADANVKTQELEELKRFGRAVTTKITAEKEYQKLPGTNSVVKVITATPPTVPFRPNRPMGGALLTGGLGLTVFSLRRKPSSTL